MAIIAMIVAVENRFIFSRFPRVLFIRSSRECVPRGAAALLALDHPGVGQQRALAGRTPVIARTNDERQATAQQALSPVRRLQLDSAKSLPARPPYADFRFERGEAWLGFTKPGRIQLVGTEVTSPTCFGTSRMGRVGKVLHGICNDPR